MNDTTPFDAMLETNPVLRMGFEAVQKADPTAADLARSYWLDGYLCGKIAQSDSTLAKIRGLKERLSRG